jgi:hypothetical protein
MREPCKLKTGPEPNGNPLLRAAGKLVALALRGLPRRDRFRAAVSLAHAIEPVIRRTGAYRTRRLHGTDTLRDTSLELILMVLTRYGTAFDPVLAVTGEDHLTGPQGGPTLIIGPHTMLSTLFVRYLEDRGYAPLIITPESDFRVAGTPNPARVLTPTPALLFKARRHFKNGGTIAGMIDRGAAERRTVQLSAGGTPLLVSAALLRLALRHQARVIFIATKLAADGTIVTRLARPSRNDVAGVLEDFAGFVDAVRRDGADSDAPALTNGGARQPL